MERLDLLGRPLTKTETQLLEIYRTLKSVAAQTDLLLCRDDCAGLCPKCGADLNAGPCDCRATPAEPV